MRGAIVLVATLVCVLATSLFSFEAYRLVQGGLKQPFGSEDVAPINWVVIAGAALGVRLRLLRTSPTGGPAAPDRSIAPPRVASAFSLLLAGVSLTVVAIFIYINLILGTTH